MIDRKKKIGKKSGKQENRTENLVKSGNEVKIRKERKQKYWKENAKFMAPADRWGGYNDVFKQQCSQNLNSSVAKISSLHTAFFHNIVISIWNDIYWTVFLKSLNIHDT